MDKIHVLHIVPTLGYGGVAKFLMHYYEFFDKECFCFDFVTHGKQEDYHEKLIQEGSQIFYISQPHEVGIKSYLKQIDMVIKHHSFDVIHIHTGHHTGVLAAYCKWHGIRHVICHAHTTRCMNSHHVLLMPLFRWLARHYAERLFACGHDAGVFCYGTEQFTIIPNGVNLSKFKKLPKDECLMLKKKLLIPPRNQIIGCVAAFTHQKNHEYLLRVFVQYHVIHPDSTLLLVGDGELRNELEQKVSDYDLTSSVVFVGNQDNIPLFLSLFDVFVLTSRHEGLPVVSAEAQALGIPCVFSDQIDHSCDLGLGLLSFLPITDAAIPLWIERIQDNNSHVSRKKIEEIFARSGYDVYFGSRKLMKIYEEMVNNK